MTLKDLQDLAMREHYKDKTLPEYARYIKPYSDKTANGLTRCIIDFINYSGGQAERISVTGRYIDNSKIVTDVIGRQRKIGSGQWIKSSMTKGSADVASIIPGGKTVKWEIKIGKDKQSEHQKNYQQSVERAGGYYFSVSSWDDFLDKYNSLF
jgi:hypothetical protein